MCRWEMSASVCNQLQVPCPLCVYVGLEFIVELPCNWVSYLMVTYTIILIDLNGYIPASPTSREHC